MNPSGDAWLGMAGAQWLCLLAALFVVQLLVDAFLGHYRSGFAVRAQYTPLIVGGALVVALATAAIAPHLDWTRSYLRVTGWAAIGLSLIGVGYHGYFGFIEKPGGLRWWLHHLMYHAPLAAPFGLAIGGALALTAEASLEGTPVLAGVSPSRAMTFIVAVTSLGLASQAFIYHYRGAFKNPMMYVPLVVAVGATTAAIWRASSPSSPTVGRVYQAALWTTFIVGFVGSGWHLRGIDRMMGGLYVTLPNVLEGPPLTAPLLFSVLAAQGLVGERLL